jgi:hypothetical protein
MKFNTGDRVWFRSTTSARVFYGAVVKCLEGNFYLVTDGTGLAPRIKHEVALNKTQPKCDGVFA